MTDIKDLEKNFNNKDLLELALTHRSWVNEHKGVRNHNERLEFLGDAVLEFVVSNELYRQFPEKEEGYLTALRANLVNTISLADLATSLNLGSLIHLSKGEEDGGGRENPSLLADTVEAVIGAIFIDQGIEKAEDFIRVNLLIDLEKRTAGPLKDAKSRLQELVQGTGVTTPKYQVASESGPDHNKKFVVEVSVDGEVWGQGMGKSKAIAEQEAALQALGKKVKYPKHG